MTAFISYSDEREPRTQLVYALREHGVTPWRDVEDLDLGNRTTNAIEAELAECSGVILWVNEQVLRSAYVASVELPAIARAARDRGIRIAPVFDGLSPSDASERVSRLGIEIGESNGHVVDQTASSLETAAAIAARYASAEVKAACANGREPIVRLITYDDTAPRRGEAVLNLDWRHALASDDATPDVEARLRKALLASTGALKAAYGASQIALAAKAHLPAAAALGHSFAETTGCTVRMDRDGAIYTADRTIADIADLQVTWHLKGPIDARAAAVEVAVTRDSTAGVSAHVADGHRYRDRATLTPSAGSGRFALDGPESCNAWAHQVGNLLTELGARPDIDRVDLFMACPVELAVAIGWWANATGPVTLMNWAGKTGPYTPMWHLP
ncbi:MAG: SAVED domain-containing protein [Acidimicrobiia bacterium]